MNVETRTKQLCDYIKVCTIPFVFPSSPTNLKLSKINFEGANDI